MSKVCELTGKRVQTGYNVSFSNKKTKRRFLPNLFDRNLYLPEEKRWIRVRICKKALRTIDKKGVMPVVREARRKGYLRK